MDGWMDLYSKYATSDERESIVIFCFVILQIWNLAYRTKLVGQAIDLPYGRTGVHITQERRVPYYFSLTVSTTGPWYVRRPQKT